MRRALPALAAFAALALLLRGAVDAATLNGRAWDFGLLLAGAAAAFVAGAVLVRRLPRRTAYAFVVGGSAVLQLLAVLGRAPGLSDDMYRYLWDGRVQAAGIDPYRYTPADPHVAFLRDQWLFPTIAHGPTWCHPVSTKYGICTLINRPRVTTIYPPIAEAYFWLVHQASAMTAALDSTIPMQLASSVLAVLTTVVIWHVLRRCGRDPRGAAWWAWCPLVPIEAGDNAHIDVLAVPLVVLGFGVLAGGLGPAGRERGRVWSDVRRSAWGGALLGLAACVKLIPAVVSPAALRRHSFRATVAVALGEGLGFLIPYIPHVVVAGGSVLGYLPGYVVENGYDSGGGDAFELIDAARRDLLGGLPPQSVDIWVAAAVMLVAAYVVSLRATPEEPWRGALVMAGIALLVGTPQYGWYGMLLVALVALDGRREWLAVAAGPYLGYVVRPFGLRPPLYVEYLVGLVVVLGVTWWRRRSRVPAAIEEIEERTPELVGV